MDEAERSYKEALRLRTELAHPSSDVVEDHIALAGAYNALGVFLGNPNQLDELKKKYRGRPAEARKKYREQVGEARKMYLLALAIQERLADKEPSTSEYQVDLAGTCNNLGNLIRDTDNVLAGRLPEALAWYRRAFDHLSKVRAADRDLPSMKQLRSKVHSFRADTLGKLGKHRESIADWDAAIRLDGSSDEDDWLRRQRWLAVARAGDHVPAMQVVHTLEKSPSLKAETAFDLACISALCSVAARADNKLSLTKRITLGESNARKAVQLLRVAGDKGLFKDARECEKLLRDRDLESLQNRDDFRALKAALLAKLAAADR
jgi:tetratricopeptide (TPR) repeat protein